MNKISGNPEIQRNATTFATFLRVHNSTFFKTNAGTNVDKKAEETNSPKTPVYYWRNNLPI